MTYRKSPALARAICASLRASPQDWAQSNHTLDHKSGIEVWTSNGFWFYAPYRPRELRFGAIGKIRFALAYRVWRRANPILRIDPASDLIAKVSA